MTSRWIRAVAAAGFGMALVASACGGGSTSPSGGGTRTVKQGPNGQLAFSPTALTVAKGSELRITNVGTAAHTFTIPGRGVNVVNQPGQTGTAAIDLPPGTYTFICAFHVGFGMRGTITVTG